MDVSESGNGTHRIGGNDSYTVYVNRALDSRGEPVAIGISITHADSPDNAAPTAMIILEPDVANRLASALLAMRSRTCESATIVVEGGRVRASEFRVV